MRYKYEYEPTYWNHRGTYQKLYDMLFPVLVPNEGNADTHAGEILRISSGLYYDIYNNGACNFDVLEKDRAKLVELVPLGDMREATYKFVKNPKNTFTHKYMKFLDLYMDWAINYANMLNTLEELESEVKAGLF